jgi:hypothetical protein
VVDETLKIVDPTKNVEDLVRALADTSEKLRTADARRLDDLRLADTRRTDDLRRADETRLSELASQKSTYDRQIFDIQTVQVKTTSDLISAQLSKETASLANQINAATVQNQGLISTLSERIGKLEQERWTVSGRSSVADPAMSEALKSIQELLRAGTKTETRRENTAGLMTGVVAAAIATSAVVTVVSFLFAHAHG